MDNSNKAVKFFELYAIGAAITVFSYSLFFYICFMQTLESEIDKLPYKEKYKSMSFIDRNIVVTTGGALGIIFYALTPMFVDALSGINILKLFWTYIFPCTASYNADFRFFQTKPRNNEAINRFERIF